MDGDSIWDRIGIIALSTIIVYLGFLDGLVFNSCYVSGRDEPIGRLPCLVVVTLGFIPAVLAGLVYGAYCITALMKEKRSNIRQ